MSTYQGDTKAEHKARMAVWSEAAAEATVQIQQLLGVNIVGNRKLCQQVGIAIGTAMQRAVKHEQAMGGK